MHRVERVDDSSGGRPRAARGKKGILFAGRMPALSVLSPEECAAFALADPLPILSPQDSAFLSLSSCFYLLSPLTHAQTLLTPEVPTLEFLLSPRIVFFRE